MPSVCSPKKACSPSAFSSSDRFLVWTGKKSRTKGGLTKDDLKIGSNGKIVSKVKSQQAKKNKPLGKHLGVPPNGKKSKSPAKGKKSKSPAKGKKSPRPGTRKSPRTN